MLHSSTTRLATAFLLTITFGVTSVFAQSALDGAWEVTHAKSDSVEYDQPGLYLFQGEYYSVLHVWSSEPRPLYEEDEGRGSVDLERLRAVVGPVEGNSGKYAIDGSTVTLTPMVAISPNFMNGGSSTYTFSINGDELTLQTEEDGGRELTLHRLH